MYEPLLPWLYLLLLIGYAIMIVLRPSMLLRPSVFFSVEIMIIFNIAAAFIDWPVFGELMSMDLLRFTTVLFPLPVMLWALATPRLSNATARVYGACRNAGRRRGGLDWRERAITRYLMVATVIIAVAYLVTVPFFSTGLWMLLIDPSKTSIAREMSVKGVESSTIVYLYSLFRTVIAPPLFVLLVLGIWRGRPLSSLLMIACAIAVVFIVTLEGARMPAGWLLVTLAIGWMLLNGIHRGLVVMGVMGAVVLALVLGLTVLRESGDRSVEEVGMDNYAEAILGRAFVVPLETGVRGVLFAEETGWTGIHTIRPLAMATNERFTNLPLEVYQRTYPGVSKLGSINTSFLFDLQVSFGLWTGWFIALGLLCLLDFVVLAFERLSGLLVAAFYAAFLNAITYLTFSAFTTSLVTGGLLLMPILVHILIWIARLERSSTSTLVFPDGEGAGSSETVPG